jgi:hypothetical protein
VYDTNDTTDIGAKNVLSGENSHPSASKAEGCVSRGRPRGNETIAQCDKRLKRDCERKTIKRQHESAMDSENRLKSMRNSIANSRGRETTPKNIERLENNRLLTAKTRHEESINKYTVRHEKIVNQRQIIETRKRLLKIVLG